MNSSNDQFDLSLDSTPSDEVSRAGAGAHGIELSADGAGVMVPVTLPSGAVSGQDVTASQSAAFSGAAVAGAPMRRVGVPSEVPVSQLGFREIIGGAYQAFLMGDGEPPTAEKISSLIDVSVTLIKRVQATKEYEVACKLRGVPVKVVGLTPEQELCLQLLSDPTIKGGLNERLKKAGVSFAKYRAWAKQPLFRDRLNNLQGGILKEVEGDMLTTLAERAVGGDQRAIEFSLEVTGRHNPRQQAQTDVKAVVAQIIEILQQEIKDPDTLNRIGLRMQGAVLGQQAQIEE